MSVRHLSAWLLTRSVRRYLGPRSRPRFPTSGDLRTRLRVASLEDRAAPGTVLGGVAWAAVSGVATNEPLGSLALITGDPLLLLGPQTVAGRAPARPAAVSTGELQNVGTGEGQQQTLVVYPVPTFDTPSERQNAGRATPDTFSANVTFDDLLDGVWDPIGMLDVSPHGSRPSFGDLVGSTSADVHSLPDTPPTTPAIEPVRFVGQSPAGQVPTGPSESADPLAAPFTFQPVSDVTRDDAPSALKPPPSGPLSPDPLPVITVTADDPTASEAGPSTGVFRLTRDDASAPLTVFYSLSSDSAVNGVDYKSLSGSVTFDENVDVHDELVIPIPDGLETEGPETVTLTITPDAAYTVGTPDKATVTILDDSPTVVSVYAQVPFAAEAGGTGQFLFVRTGDITLDLAVPYTVGGTATPAGQSGADHNLGANGSVTIPAGLTYTTLNVYAVNDTTVESPESVVVSVDTGVIAGGGPTSATVMIVDDDVLPYVSVIASTPYGFEGGTGGTFTFTRTGSTAQAISVTIVSNEFWGSDPTTATPDVDYVALPTAVTFAPGQVTQTLSVQTIDDKTPELPETVTVRVVPGTDYQLGLPSTATCTIIDNDVPPSSGGSGGGSTYVLTASAPDPDASETGPDNGLFRLTRSGIPLGSSQTIQPWEWSLQGSSASGYYGPSGGGDYDISQFFNMTFPAGSATVDVPVIVYDDGIVEGPETVILSTMGSGGWSKAVVVIQDDDDVPIVNAEPVADAAEQGLVTGKFRITRSGGLNWPVTVTYSLGGSATPGWDHTAAASGKIEFAAGQTEAYVDVPPIDDTEVEGPEAVTLALDGTTGGSTGYYVGSSPQAAITIRDGDNYVSVAAADPHSSESGPSTGAFAITRIADMTRSVTVGYTIAGTAKPAGEKGADHDLSKTGSVTFGYAEGRKVVLETPVDDVEGEETETVEMTLDNGPGFFVGIAQAIVDILDNDPWVLDLDVDSDNDNGFGKPDESRKEDKMEDVENDVKRPGKITPVNDEDKDGDYIPDFADGFSLSKAGMTDQAKADAVQMKPDAGLPAVPQEFVRVVLKLPPTMVDLSQAFMYLSYDGSNPDGVTYNQNLDIYSPGPGAMRLWTKPEDAQRNPAALNGTTGGDYVPPGTYTWAKLGIDVSTTRRIEFYLEGISASAAVADKWIDVRLDGEPAGIGNLTDTVRITLADVDVERKAAAGGWEDAGDFVPLFRPDPVMALPDLAAADVAGADLVLPAAKVVVRDRVSAAAKLAYSINGGGWTDITGSLQANGTDNAGVFERALAADKTFAGLATYRDQPIGTRTRFQFRGTNTAGRYAYDEFVLETRLDPAAGKRVLEPVNLGPAPGDVPAAIPDMYKLRITVAPLLQIGADDKILALPVPLYRNGTDGKAAAFDTLTKAQYQTLSEFVIVDDGRTDTVTPTGQPSYPHFRRNHTGAATHWIDSIKYTPIPAHFPLANYIRDKVQAVYFDAKAFLSDDDTESTNPTPVRTSGIADTAANFDQNKPVMWPVTITGKPARDVAGKPNRPWGKVTIALAGAGGSLWKTDGTKIDTSIELAATDFTAASPSKQYLLHGTAVGSTPSVTVSYSYRGKVIQSDEAMFKVIAPPQFAGDNVIGYPYVNYANVFNKDVNFATGIDPYVWSQQTGHETLTASPSAKFAVVQHRSPAEWAATPAFAYGTAAVPAAAALNGKNMGEGNNRRLQAANAAGFFDVVIDLANAAGENTPDGILNPGDLIGVYTADKAAAEVRVLTDPGNQTQAGIAGSAYVEYQFADYWQPAPAVDDVRVRLRGRITYPTAAGAAQFATAPVVQGTGNGTVMGGAVTIAGGATDQFWSGVYLAPTAGAPAGTLGDWYFTGSADPTANPTPVPPDALNTKWDATLDGGNVTFRILPAAGGGAVPFASGDRIWFNVTHQMTAGQYPVVALAHGNHGPFLVGQPKFFRAGVGDFDSREDMQLTVANVNKNAPDAFAFTSNPVYVERTAAGKWQASQGPLAAKVAIGAPFNDNTRVALTDAAGVRLADIYIRPAAAVAYAAGDYFLVTSNDRATTTAFENYRGYDYLAQYLARNGFVVVSVSLDDLQTADSQNWWGIPGWGGSQSGINERAKVLAQHLQRIAGNATLGAVNILDNLDLGGTKLSFADTTVWGHSRGGEAVAQVVNLGGVPGVTIGQVVSVAPTTQPGGTTAVAAAANAAAQEAATKVGVPYLAVYGSEDGDVDWGGGFIIADRSTSERQVVYLKQANHNYFSQSWVQNDSGARANAFNGAGGEAASRTAHKDVLKAYMMAFLSANVTRPMTGAATQVAINTDYKDYFRRGTDALRVPALNAGWGVTQYLFPGSAGFTAVDRFEANNQAATPNDLGQVVPAPNFVTGNGAATQYNLRWWNGDEAFPGGVAVAPYTTTEDRRYNQWTYAEELAWDTTVGLAVGKVPSYVTRLGGLNAAGSPFLTVRLALRREDALNPDDKGVTLTLVDTAGKEASIQTQPIVTLSKAFERDNRDPEKAHFVTIRVPLTAFLHDGGGVNMTTLQELRIVFDQRNKGAMAIDDIAFERNI